MTVQIAVGKLGIKQVIVPVVLVSVMIAGNKPHFGFVQYGSKFFFKRSL
jgi:hypothetical protein